MKSILMILTFIYAFSAHAVSHEVLSIAGGIAAKVDLKDSNLHNVVWVQMFKELNQNLTQKEMTEFRQAVNELYDQNIGEILLAVVKNIDNLPDDSNDDKLAKIFVRAFSTMGSNIQQSIDTKVDADSVVQIFALRRTLKFIFDTIGCNEEKQRLHQDELLAVLGVANKTGDALLQKLRQ